MPLFQRVAGSQLLAAWMSQVVYTLPKLSFMPRLAGILQIGCNHVLYTASIRVFFLNYHVMGVSCQQKYYHEALSQTNE